MDKKLLIRKLSSRKFWAGVVSYITLIAAAYGVAETNVEQIRLIISAVGALAVYMLAEGIADCGGKGD